MIEILERLAADALPAFAAFAMAALTWALTQGALFLRRKTDSEVAQYGAGALERLDAVVRDAVGATVLQREVTIALADGRLSSDELAHLADVARDEVRGLLGPSGVEALAKVVDRDAVELLIAAKVRAAIESRLGGGMLLEAVVETEGAK